MTVTTEIAKNGAINFYNAETGKRVKEADVVMDAIENGGTFYTAKTLRYSGNFADKNFASPITAYKWLARTSDGSMEIVRCDRVNGKSTYTTIYQIGCDGGDELIESAELDAHLKEIRGTSGAFTEKERREEQITLRMKSDNLSREQAEELVDYIRANREHYNSEVADTVKAMLDNFKKINNPETEDDETATVEINNVAEYTPATVEEKAEVIVPIVDYRTLLTWAEKVSNGQHDTAIQIVTHIKKWFNAETDKKTVIEVIKAGDLNGFRNFLCQFNFAVKDDGGFIHKLYRYDNGECVLVEIPTSEYAKYSVEELEAELPSGNVTGNEEVARLKEKREDISERLSKLDAVKHVLTNAEYETKAAELKDNLRYVDMQLDAINASDTFDYVTAAEHIENVYVDAKTFVDYTVREHGLTQEQCENIYVTVYTQCEFGKPDYELIDRLVEECKQANAAPDGYNPDVFSLLPKREDLNDVDGEFDEDAAEETDRDDRYNRGEKIAEGLTAKLRAFDPTVEVTYTIDDDEDTYYLSYDGIARTPFTATGVEASFHAMKQYDAETDCPPEPPTPKPNSPFDIARGLNDVFQKTFRKVDAPYLDVLTQDGAKIATNFGAAFISVDWSATDGYVFGNHSNDVLARYETPEQVTDVMTALRDAIRAGKTEFTFPTVDEIDPIDFEKFFAEHEANQPAEVKALNAELDASKLQAPHMWVRIVDGAGHHRGSFTRGLLSAVHVEYNAEPAAIEGYTLRYFDEPIRLYNTFAQVNAAVEQFKAAIISNAEAFTFPSVEALTPETPATAVEETDYEKYLKASEYVITSPGRYLGTDKFGEDRFAVTWKTRCPLRKINKATARNILATFGLTPETYLAEHSKWVAAEIKRGSLQFAIDMQAEFLRDKIDADHKASVEPMPTLYPAEDSDDDDELIDPPVKAVDAAHISDSLTRAMKTALEKFQGFCLVKNLTAAENELKLYNICRKAMTELWKEQAA